MTHSEPIRVLIVDDHPVVLDGLVTILERQAGIRVVGQCNGGREAVARYGVLRPDVTLMDLSMHDMGGIEAIVAIREHFESARFIVLTVSQEEESVYRAFEAGAQAYLTKRTPGAEIARTIAEVHRGGTIVPHGIRSILKQRSQRAKLSQREQEVLAHMGMGHSNSEICDRLGISLPTAKSHVNAIMRKLDAKNRTHAVTIALSRGLIPPQE